MKEEEFLALKENAWARNREIKAQAEENTELKAKLAASQDVITDLKGSAEYASLSKAVRDKLEALDTAEKVTEETSEETVEEAEEASASESKKA
jgi:hypothetical protein